MLNVISILLFIVGIIATIVFGILWLVYKFILKEQPKTKHGRNTLIAFGAFILSIALIGSTSDSSTLTEKNAEVDRLSISNIKLKAENEELRESTTKSDEELLTTKNELATSKIEVDELTLKLIDFDKFQQELKDQQQAHQEKSESSEKEIADLKATNSTLKTEVDSLKVQLANKSSNSTASSSNAQSSKSTTTSTQQKSGAVASPPKTPAPAKTAVSSGGSEWFQNCTELRKKYPKGVAQGHAAYQSKMDRDKDGWACER